jgi:gas vesicle protein
MLFGVLAGAGLALLFAPKPGAQLRGEIGDSMSHLRDAAARRLREVADRASAEASDLQSKMGRMKNTVTGTVRDMSEAAGEPGRPDGRTRV